jgi:hypothetical protein
LTRAESIFDFLQGRANDVGDLVQSGGCPIGGQPSLALCYADMIAVSAAEAASRGRPSRDKAECAIIALNAAASRLT